MLWITSCTELVALLLLVQVPGETVQRDPLMERVRQSVTKMAKSETVRRSVFFQRLDVMQVGIVRFDPYLSTASLSVNLPPLTGIDGQPLDAREKSSLRMRSDFTMTFEPHLAGRYAIVMVCEVESPRDGHRRNVRLPLQYTTMDGRGENGLANHPWNIELRTRDAGEYEFFRMILAVPSVEGPPILLLAARIDRVTVQPKERMEAPSKRDRRAFPSK